MTVFAKSEPLTDAELDRLGDFLKSCRGGKAMNVEELDGFFAALIAGPETVVPSEFLWVWVPTILLAVSIIVLRLHIFGRRIPLAEVRH